MAWLGIARFGAVRRGWAGQGQRRSGDSAQVQFLGAVSPLRGCKARRGEAGRGRVGPGVVGQGMARSGLAWHGEAWTTAAEVLCRGATPRRRIATSVAWGQAWIGKARLGAARCGKAGRGKAWTAAGEGLWPGATPGCCITLRGAGPGMARPGMDRSGGARFGAARQGQRRPSGLVKVRSLHAVSPFGVHGVASRG